MTLSFANLYAMPLQYMSISTVSHKINAIQIGIQYKKSCKYGESMGNITDINGEIVFCDYINSYSSNISCVNLFVNVILSCLLCYCPLFLVTLYATITFT